MATLEYFVAAESLSIDRATNKVSVFNIIEEVHPTQPGRLVPFYILASWNFEPHEVGQDFQATFRIEGPDFQKDDRTNFTVRGRRHRISLRIDGLPIAQPGTLTLSVRLNDEPQATHTIDVSNPVRPPEIS